MFDIVCYIPMMNVHVTTYICCQLTFVKQNIFQAGELMKLSQPADYMEEMLGNVAIGNKIEIVCQFNAVIISSSRQTTKE
jgi:hypothetical protein